jgi:hypothetical protein
MGEGHAESPSCRRRTLTKIKAQPPPIGHHFAHSKWRLVMRISRDWIAWSVVMAIAVVIGAYYYAQQQGLSPAGYVYKIVVTP